MTTPESPAAPPPPTVSQRHTVSRTGAPIRLERLTLSLPLRNAIARQFAPADRRTATPTATR